MGYWLLVRRDLKQRYPSAYALVGEGIGFILSLLIYWYTARAFGSGMQQILGNEAPDYFSYIIVGELAFIIPFCLVHSFQRALKEAIAEGALESFLLLPWKETRAIVALGASSLPREVIRLVFMFSIVILFFGLGVSPEKVGALVFIQLLALPIFGSLGLLVVGLYLRTGRGEGALSFITTVAAIFAGAYFPVAVLPPVVRDWGIYFSPFSALLESSRHLLGSGELFAPSFYSLLAWLVVFPPVAWMFLRTSIQVARKRGSWERVRAF